MFTHEDNLVLDRIMEARQSCRSFSDYIPSTEEVEQVIAAGNTAPYAIASVRDVEVFRHFYVLFRGDERLGSIHGIVKEQAAAEADWLQKESETDPVVEQFGQGLIGMRRLASREGFRFLDEPPCLILLAEWRGARRAEKQDHAHTIQNMWLKATALNLDMIIVSLFEGLTDNEQFCSMLGLPVGQYGFHGCVLGRKAADSPRAGRVTSRIHWPEEW